MRLVWALVVWAAVFAVLTVWAAPTVRPDGWFEMSNPSWQLRPSRSRLCSKRMRMRWHGFVGSMPQRWKKHSMRRSKGCTYTMWPRKH